MYIHKFDVAKFQDLILDSNITVLKNLRIPLTIIGCFFFSPTSNMNYFLAVRRALVTKANVLIA